MRRSMVAVALLSWFTVATPAFALNADDTMSSWKHASEKERSELLKQVLGERYGDDARILRCMDETSKTPGHTDLNIADVAKVCASAGNTEQPV